MSLLKERAIYISWVIALTGMLGSLYYSEIMGFAPCMLCQYQRIALYPLVLILGIALIRKDNKVWQYALPLAFIGWIIAIFHNLLYYSVILENAVPCTDGVSCTTEYVKYFGFVSIPLMSLAAFSVIVVLMFIQRKNE